MTEVIHADIFFFITSLAVLVVTFGVLVLLFFLIPAARDLRAVAAKIRKAGDEVEKDFESLRANVREEGTKGKMLIDLALGFISRKIKSPASRRQKKNVDESSQPL